MEKKKFKVNTFFIISHIKKSEPLLFLMNNNNELDFFRKSFELEGVGFHEEKARDMIRDFLVTHVLGKGAFANSQKMSFEKSGKREFSCKYHVSITDAKVDVKGGSFIPLKKAISVKKRMTDMLRNFLVSYIKDKK